MIVLEGLVLWISISLVLLMMIIITALALAGLDDNKKIEELQAALDAEREKNTELQVAYCKLSIKYRLKTNLLVCDDNVRD